MTYCHGGLFLRKLLEFGQVEFSATSIKINIIFVFSKLTNLHEAPILAAGK